MFPLSKTIESFHKAKLWVSLILTALIAFVLFAGFVYAITYMSAVNIEFEPNWLETTTETLIGIVSGVAGWFLLPVFMPLIAGFFEANVVRKIERVYYPGVRTGSAETFWSDLFYDVRFTIKALIINIIILPFYLIGIGFILSVIINSYLLGMEFFVNAAGYQIGKRNARELFNRNRIPVLLGGLVFTLLSLIPFVNLFVPIFAIVWMVHLYWGYINKT